MGAELPMTDRRGNAILDALPAADRDRLAAQMTLMPLKIKTILFDAGEVITHVYFPTSGVISLVTPLEEGSIVEVATIGNEGIVGVPIQPHGSLAVRAISQVAGSALRMDARAFLEESERQSALRNLVRNYTLALFGQISQAAACNRLHSSEERLSRWLLMSQDRVGRDEFRITHDFLGQMLGSRRATVSLSAGVLQNAGLIRYSRG
jgi:CRP-like cAMP-binding protein